MRSNDGRRSQLRMATTTTNQPSHPTPPPPHPTSRTTFAAQFKAFSLLRCASHRFDHPCSPSHPPPCRHRRPLSCSRRSPFHCSSSHSLLSLLPSTSHLPALPTVRVPPRKQVELEMIKNKNWKKKKKKKLAKKKKKKLGKKKKKSTWPKKKVEKSGTEPKKPTLWKHVLKGRRVSTCIN